MDDYDVDLMPKVRNDDASRMVQNKRMDCAALVGCCRPYFGLFQGAYPSTVKQLNPQQA
jgi:hypothetical protein